MKSSKHLDLLLYLWYIIFVVSLVCCFRAVTSISIGLILITGFFKNKTDTGSWLNKNLKSNFPAACFLFYVLQVMALLYQPQQHEALKNLQLKSAIPLVPIAFCCSSFLNNQVRQKIMGCYIWILAGALFYCLLMAADKYYFMKAPDTVFFYHHLVAPLKQHAVQVSILVFTGLLFLLEKAKNGTYLHYRSVHLLLTLFLTCCILLLSSKLVIIFTAGCFVYYAIHAITAKQNSRLIIFISLFVGLAGIAIVLSTQNKVSSRFREIVYGDTKLIQQQNFNPGIYFNGLQFRELEVRFVKEILTEQHAWLTGVSDDAQPLLDKKYTGTHMYIGDGISADRGFLGYNTHNQFLESVLRSGIPGLLVFILVCFTLILMAFRRKNNELSFIVLILIAYCFNESVFETQYGITLFTFLPLFLYYGTGKGPDMLNTVVSN